jgi:hypothetical protein
MERETQREHGCRFPATSNRERETDRSHANLAMCVHGQTHLNKTTIPLEASSAARHFAATNLHLHRPNGRRTSVVDHAVGGQGLAENRPPQRYMKQGAQPDSRNQDRQPLALDLQIPIGGGGHNNSDFGSDLWRPIESAQEWQTTESS